MWVRRPTKLCLLTPGQEGTFLSRSSNLPSLASPPSLWHRALLHSCPVSSAFYLRRQISVKILPYQPFLPHQFLKTQTNTLRTEKLSTLPLTWGFLAPSRGSDPLTTAGLNKCCWLTEPSRLNLSLQSRTSYRAYVLKIQFQCQFLKLFTTLKLKWILQTICFQSQLFYWAYLPINFYLKTNKQLTNKKTKKPKTTQSPPLLSIWGQLNISWKLWVLTKPAVSVLKHHNILWH